MSTRTLTRIETGIRGLDEILHGGFVPKRSYLVTGSPGTGKTTFGMHFLSPPRSEKARRLFVSFTETEANLREDADAVGIDAGDISFLDLTPEADMFSEVQSYDIFSPVEVERDPIAHAMRAKIEEVDPKRIFVDGFSELRMIASDMFHYVRMVQSFFRFATSRGATVVVSASEGLPDVDIALRAIVDGIIHLSGGSHARSLEMLKMRGSDFASGPHPLRITGAGLEVFPDSV
jgi:circadian clock protein KaiC